MVKPGDIITADLTSKHSALVLSIEEDGSIMVQNNENSVTPPGQYIWQGPYIKLAEVRGNPKDWK